MDAASGNQSSDSLTSEQIALYGAMIIGNARVYDVMLMILKEMNPAAAVELRKRHEQGLMWFPPPTFREDDEGA